MNKQIEQIKAEIERLNNKYKYLSSISAKHKTDCYTDLLSFINSLPEEPSDNIGQLNELPTSANHSEDLENEIQRYLATECAGDDEPSVGEIARYFANWQKAQMMKDAIETVMWEGDLLNPIFVKRKVIVVKEDEK